MLTNFNGNLEGEELLRKKWQVLGGNRVVL
jgi:hypothetical protein